jgi:hypothetical protein
MPVSERTRFATLNARVINPSSHPHSAPHVLAEA